MSPRRGGSVVDTVEVRPDFGPRLRALLTIAPLVLFVGLAATAPRVHAAQEQSTEEVLNEVLAAAAPAAARNYCAIVLLQDGAIRANADNSELTSRGFGGWPAEAEVTASNSSYQMSIDPVLGFSTAPAGAEDGTVFAPSYSGAGATNFSETAGNIPVRVKGGSTRVRVNFRATNLANPFPAGDYRAELTLRCE